MANTTGKPPSQTAQPTDWASAPAQLCRLAPWDKERPRGTCSALSHRGKLGPAPFTQSKCHESMPRPRALRGLISSASLPCPRSEPAEKEESQVSSWPKSSFMFFCKQTLGQLIHGDSTITLITEEASFRECGSFVRAKLFLISNPL